MGGPLAQLIITGIKEAGEILFDLISGKASIEEAKQRMTASVEKMHAALQPGGVMDQAIAGNKDTFTKELKELAAQFGITL